MWHAGVFSWALLVAEVLAIRTPRKSPRDCGAQVLPSQGCTGNGSLGQAPGTTQRLSMTSAGVQRWYYLHLPASYHQKTPSPVILSYHGGSRDAKWQMELDGLKNEPASGNFVLVYPDGLNNTWEGVPQSHAGNDIQFTQDILDNLERQLCVDKTRIYATGKSNGGFFVNRLACDPNLSRRIAAFAPVAASFYVTGVTGAACDPRHVTLSCNPDRKPIPMMEIHGGNDTVIPYCGETKRKESCLPDILYWATEWAVRNGLPEDPAVRMLAGTRNGAVVFEWGAGLWQGVVTHIFSPGLGHAWPSTEPNLDTTTKGLKPSVFSANPHILNFFNRHTLNSAG